ncbi:MAG: AMP-binding protein, partial [bacterium]|nr:AMP-binding protein [bacterium]
QLPLDHPRPPVKSFQGKVHAFQIAETQTRVLKELAAEEGATYFMVLLAIYTVFLAQMTRQEDIVVGTSIAGRRHADLNRIIGMFVNALVLRNYPQPGKTFNSFLKELKTRTMGAYENQELPFEELVEFVGGKRDTSRNPIFDTMFVMNNEEDPGEFRATGFAVKPYAGYRHKSAQMDLKMRTREEGEILQCSFEYSTDLFKPETPIIFEKSFREVVEAVIKNRNIRLGDISVTYALAREIEMKKEDYWLQKLSGEPIKSHIPYDTIPKEKETVVSTRLKYESIPITIPGELSQRLAETGTPEETGLHNELTAALAILLHKYIFSGNNDILTGTPVHKDTATGKTGNKVLVTRTKIQKNTTIKELLEAVARDIEGSLKHHDIDIKPLADRLNMTAPDGSYPYFDVALLLESLHKKSHILPTAPNLLFSFLKRAETETGALSILSTPSTPSTVSGPTGEYRIEGKIEYNPTRYSRDTIEAIAGHYVRLLEQIATNPNSTISSLEMLREEEKKRLLYQFNDTALEYPKDRTIHGLFEEKVERTPDTPAVIGYAKTANGTTTQRQTLTYRQLSKKAGRLAGQLLKKGITPETPVGIMMEPSVNTAAGLMGILKAGGAYLPIDPGLPPARVKHMLQDSNAGFFLSHKKDSMEMLPGVRTVVTPPAHHIKAFNDLPVPDRTLISLGNYKNKIGMASVTNSISIQATRGCPYKCIYCHKVWSKFHVYRSAENIFDEVSHFYKKGVRNFAFIDDCFNLNMANSSKFFRKVLENKMEMQIFFPNGLRGDTMTPEYIDLMVEAGVRGINLSLETASPRLQKLLKKHLDIDKFREVMEYIAGRHPEVVLEIATMHGFPTESEEEAMMTLDFIKSIKWLHFPYIHILKIYPNTEMEEFALEHGVAKDDILRSKDLAFHELPDTLPYPKSFTRQYQADFLNNYFLSQERLRHVLPVQMQVLSEEALVQKYNTYLPAEIGSVTDILDFTGLRDMSAMVEETRKEEPVPELFQTPPEKAGDHPPKKGAKRILMLDLTRHFSSHSMLYNVSEQPIGLVYLMTYIHTQFPETFDSRIYKSGDDFDSFEELKQLTEAYQPDLVGIRSLTFYKEFFHETVSQLRQWGIEAPIIAGGPYAASDYDTLLKDRNVQLAVMGEGEYILEEILEKMLANDFKIPAGDVLKTIRGIAFKDRSERQSCELIYPEHVFIETAEHSLQDSPMQSKRPKNGASTTSPLAYILYTSGTTGRPKGVMVEHRQVLNCLYWMQDVFKLEPHHQVVQRTPLTFDPSVWEVFWPLVTGAATHILPKGPRKDAGQLIDLLSDNEELTVMYCTATLVTAIAAYMNANPPKNKLKLPYFLTGAEPISMDTVKTIYRFLEGKFVNTYGPTEGTINNTWYPFQPNETRKTAPIGKPVANNQVYILGKKMELMPEGAVGEICLSGDSIVRGYLNRPELTGERFMTTSPLRPLRPYRPLRQESADPPEAPATDGTYYRTGDLGRWLPDGEIEILGRIDQQMKVRGYRVEPGEIETVLQKCDSVDECVVIASDGTQWDTEIQRCKVCGITSSYGSVTIQADGRCNWCTGYEKYLEDIKLYFKNLDDLKTLIRKKNADEPGDYDCLILYNGGRSAGYALYQLVEMGVNVLAVTYNNGYFSKKDLANIKRTTDSVGVDHVIVTHDQTDPILKRSIEKAHTVCRGCFHISSSLAGYYAYKHNIKVTIGATLSRGQILENKLLPFLGQGITDLNELEAKVTDMGGKAKEIDKDIFDLIAFEEIMDGTVSKHVTPVDFYRYCDITNPEMIAYLDDRDPYWETKKKYAIYSTNCSIKQLGDYGVLREAGIHYYGGATSWEKRLGHITIKNLEEDLTCFIKRPQHDRFMERFGLSGSSEKKNELFIAAYIVSHDGDIDINRLREQLSRQLPDYMVPSYFSMVDKIPLTPNGKLDTTSLPDPRKDLLTEVFVQPEEGIQETLARTWSEILNLDKVGIDDNFFQVGGDSIKAIQVSAQLLPQQLKVEIKDIFDNPTIRQLENFVKPLQQETNTAQQGIVEGKIPMGPIQHWFFNNFDAPHRHHFNQTVMLVRKEGFDEGSVRQLLTRITEHHDALRIVYTGNENKYPGIRQENRPAAEPLYRLDLLDFSSGAERETLTETEEKEIAKAVTRLQRTIQLENGPLVHAGLFKTGSGDHLLLVVHHLVIDGISWRILLEDMATGYKQAEEGVTVRFPEKTNSFKEWMEQLEQYAQSPELLAEIPYWNNIENTDVPQLPQLHPAAEHTLREGENNGKDILETRKRKYLETVSLNLNETETRSLLTEVNRRYNTGVNDILLTGLAAALYRWTGTTGHSVNLEGHGREPVIPGVTVSRTVGWFTSFYPVILALNTPENTSLAIREIKEKLRNIPKNGIGYSILHYLTPVEKREGMTFSHEPQINFNYLGQFDEEMGEEGEIRISPLDTGESISPELESMHALDINGMTARGRLSLAITYSGKEYQRIDIEKLALYYRQALQEIILHCMEKKERTLTPSDLTFSGISIPELEELQHRFAMEKKQIANIYPLSP